MINCFTALSKAKKEKLQKNVTCIIIMMIIITKIMIIIRLACVHVTEKIYTVIFHFFSVYFLVILINACNLNCTIFFYF
jgi:hypothetical protein